MGKSGLEASVPQNEETKRKYVDLSCGNKKKKVEIKQVTDLLNTAPHYRIHVASLPED